MRRNIIQLVRTTYDATSKKPKAQVVGRIPLANPEIPNNLLALLSAEEAQETVAWIATEGRKQLLREELAALTLAETLELAEAWLLRQDKSPQGMAVAAAILPRLLALRKTVKRALD